MAGGVGPEALLITPIASTPVYVRSVATLLERVGGTGATVPVIARPPRAHDEQPGPSIFRMGVEDADLGGLTLPGLYVARSELRRVSFRSADLRLSAFNWSDAYDCSFEWADLSGADLRSCRFVRCRSTSAVLAEADLRHSSFSGCSFAGAVLTGAAAYERRLLGIRVRRQRLPIAPDQRAAMAWSNDAGEPPGG